MSTVEQKWKRTVIQGLKTEISRLKGEQTAAEKIAALVGMTAEDSEKYKKRHHRIRRLTEKLTSLNREQGAVHDEQKETQEIAGKSPESHQADPST